jgi:hypothetical protein
LIGPRLPPFGVRRSGKKHYRNQQQQTAHDVTLPRSGARLLAGPYALKKRKYLKESAYLIRSAADQRILL